MTKNVSTTFSNSGCLIIPKDAIENGASIKVCQMGSNNTEFRSSNEIIYIDPDAVYDSQEDPAENLSK